MIMPLKELELNPEEKKVTDELVALIQMYLRTSDRDVFCKICRFYNALCLRDETETSKARLMILKDLMCNREETESLLQKVENLFNRKRSPGRLSLCGD